MEFTPNHVRSIISKLALALVCLTATTAYAGPPSWLRAITSEGSGDSCNPSQCDDTAYSIKVTPDGSQYVTGRFSSTIRFGGTTLVSAGGLDMFLAKYGRYGKLLWIVQAGGASDDEGVGVDFDKAGNVYVAGGFTNSATFGSVDGKTKTVTGNGSTIFLAKYLSSGDLVWVQTGIASGGVNGASGLAVNRVAGTVYISAASQGDVTFSSANGNSNTVPGVGDWHMVLAKYDTSGNFQWGETDAATPNSLPYGVAVDNKDNAYVTGWLEDTTTFYSNDGHNITIVGFSPAHTTGDYPDDAFLVKYDGKGDVKWVNHLGGYVARGSNVAISPAGDVTVVGALGNINYGTPSEAYTLVTSQPPGKTANLGGGDFTDPYNMDIFIITYNPAGVLRKAIRRGNSQQEAASGVAYDRSGHLYVSGILQDPVHAQNVFVMKYSGGKFLWRRIAGNAGVWITDNPELSPALAVDPAGRVFVTGSYQGTATFGKFNLKANGAASIFLAELPPD